ncbi:MAG: hypothetical protein JSS62_00590 [Verrucomicrobia bacterium]|nr:hypothetical protein [Verrucomicrobiota bacterium]MBS0646630.1 hypothetical protein [Verrucomicrobiota bacterium]
MNTHIHGPSGSPSLQPPDEGSKSSEQKSLAQRVSAAGQGKPFPFSLFQGTGLSGGWKAFTGGVSSFFRTLFGTSMSVTAKELATEQLSDKVKKQLVKEWKGLSKGLSTKGMDEKSLKDMSSFFNKISHRDSGELADLKQQVEQDLGSYLTRLSSRTDVPIEEVRHALTLRNSASQLASDLPSLPLTVLPELSSVSMRDFGAGPLSMVIQDLEKLAVYAQCGHPEAAQQYKAVLSVLSQRCFSEPAPAPDVRHELLDSLTQQQDLVRGSALAAPLQTLRQRVIAAELSDAVQDLNRQTEGLGQRLARATTVQEFKDIKQQWQELKGQKDLFVETGYPKEKIKTIDQAIEQRLAAVIQNKADAIHAKTGKIANSQQVAGDLKELVQLTALSDEDRSALLGRAFGGVATRASMFAQIDKTAPLQVIEKQIEELQKLYSALSSTDDREFAQSFRGKLEDIETEIAEQLQAHVQATSTQLNSQLFADIESLRSISSKLLRAKDQQVVKALLGSMTSAPESQHRAAVQELFSAPLSINLPLLQDGRPNSAGFAQHIQGLHDQEYALDRSMARLDQEQGDTDTKDADARKLFAEIRALEKDLEGLKEKELPKLSDFAHKKGESTAKYRERFDAAVLAAKEHNRKVKQEKGQTEQKLEQLQAQYQRLDVSKDTQAGLLDAEIQQLSSEIEGLPLETSIPDKSTLSKQRTGLLRKESDQEFDSRFEKLKAEMERKNKEIKAIREEKVKKLQALSGSRADLGVDAGSVHAESGFSSSETAALERMRQKQTQSAERQAILDQIKALSKVNSHLDDLPSYARAFAVEVFHNQDLEKTEASVQTIKTRFITQMQGLKLRAVSPADIQQLAEGLEGELRQAFQI